MTKMMPILSLSKLLLIAAVMMALMMASLTSHVTKSSVQDVAIAQTVMPHGSHAQHAPQDFAQHLTSSDCLILCAGTSILAFVAPSLVLSLHDFKAVAIYNSLAPSRNLSPVERPPRLV